MDSFRQQHWLLGIAVGMTSLTAPVAAQTGSSGSSAQLDEIIVTATRREESLLDVPVAVSAIQGETLQQRQITDVESLQRIAPGLSTAPFGDGTSPLLSIRGQVAQDIVASVDPAVGVYVDGVYLGRATGGNLSFIDVERVEVLRGPQGTLFGRNTIGGAISITPNHPTDRVEGQASLRFGSYDMVGLTGVLNLPISDGIAARIVGHHQQHDGYARSSLTGTPLSDQDLDYLRGSVKADLGGGWDVLVSGDYTNSRSSGQWFTLVKPLASGETLAKAVSGGTQTLAQYADAFDRTPASQTRGPQLSRNWGVSGIVSGEFGAASFKSITAYRKVHRDLDNLDQDGTPFELLQIASNDSRQHQFSQELQLYGKALNDKLDWIVGAYYFDETGSDTVAARFFYPLASNFNITDATAFNRNMAAYGQVTYSLADQFEVVGGIRYARDTRRLDLFSRSATTTPAATLACAVRTAILPTCLVALPKKTFDYVPFSIGVNFKPWDKALLYAKWSRGFRSGGYNSRGATEQSLLPFGPERVDSYELGAKFEVAGILRVSGDVFQSEFDGIQILSQVDTGPGSGVVAINQNAGKARIRGLELETQLVLGNLNLSGALALTDYKYVKLAPNVIGLVQGSPLTYTPKTTFSVSADYAIPADFGEIVLHGDYGWRSRSFFAAVPPNDPAQQQASYGLLNASITLNAGEGLSLSAFGKNLTNEHYLNRTTGGASLGYISGYPGDPRTYGGSVTYRF